MVSPYLLCPGDLIGLRDGEPDIPPNSMAECATDRIIGLEVFSG